MLHSGDNDSIELSLDMNAALPEIQMNQTWCNECPALKQSLEDLQAAFNHKATIISDLKEKIIPTDQLITDFYAKQEENQMLTKSLETCRRHCDELDQQLHSALARLEPLREANGKYERHIQRYEHDIEKLKAENEAYKICQQQLNLAHGTLLEKVRKLEDEKKEGQASLRRSESRLKKFQEEVLTRKKENSCLKKENTSLENEIRVLKAKLEKFKNADASFGSFKPFLRNNRIESFCPRKTEIFDHEISSLLTCSILQMLPPMLSPMACSDAGMSDTEAFDNDQSINHFASQLEAKLGCSDDHFPLPIEYNDDGHSNIDGDRDNEESGSDETGSMPVDKVNRLKKSSNLLTKGRLESQMSTGFDAPTDRDDMTHRVSADHPKCSLFSSSLTCVPSALEFVPSDPLVQKVTTEAEASGGLDHSAARHRVLSSSSDDGALSASILPLDILNKSQSFLSATHPLASPVSDNKPLNASSTCCTSVVSSSSASTLLSSSSFVPVSSNSVICHAVSPTSFYSLRSASSGTSRRLTSATPRSMLVCTTKSSVAPIMSSEVSASSNIPGLYSTGAPLSSPVDGLPPVSSYAVPTCNENSSAVCGFSASTDVQLTSACLPDVKSRLTSLEIPVISSGVSATSFESPNTVSLYSPPVTVMTQCPNAVILDSVKQSSSSVSGVNSGASEVVQLPTSAHAIVLASTNVPLYSSCVAASGISFTALPRVSAVTSSTLDTSLSSASVVSCDSVPLYSSSVTAKASSTADDASLLSGVNIVAATTCNNVLARVTLSNSTMSCNSSISSQSVSLSLSASMSISSCTSLPLSSLSSALPKNEVFPSKLEASLNRSSLLSQISIEDIFSFVSISPPLSPIQSPRSREKIRRKPLKSKQPTASSDLPSAAAVQISTSPVTVSSNVEEAKQKQLSTVSSVDHLLSEVDTKAKAVKHKTAMLGFPPFPCKVKKIKSFVTDVHLARGESYSTGRVPQSDFVFRAKDMATNDTVYGSVDDRREETSKDMRLSCPQSSVVALLHQNKIDRWQKRTVDLIVDYFPKQPATNVPTLPGVSKPDVFPTIRTSYSSELIDSIIKEALALNEDMLPIWFDRCTSGQTPTSWPWLTPSQHRILSDICKRGDVVLLQDFCKRAVQVLSYTGDIIVTSGNIALCCIFVGVCRYMGDVERVRVFAFDAVKCHLVCYASLITAVAAIWPLPLHVNNCSSEFAPVLHVLQHAILTKSLDAAKPKHRRMKACLEHLCGWRFPSETGDEIAKHLLTHLEDVLKQSPAFSQELTWNVELAFDLLCVSEGWQWSNNFVVVQLLWPILASWAANPAEVKNQAFIEAVIGILGLVMSHCPVTLRSNTDHILNILLKLLREPTVAVPIQISVLRALLLLAKYQPDCCATMCLQWVKDHKNDLDSVTKAMLQDFHGQFSSRLKYLSELVID